MQRYRCFVTCVQTSRFFFLLLSKGLFYIVESGVLLAKENEFPLKTGDKTVGLGLMGKRKTGTSARREKAKLRTALFQRQYFSIYKLQNFYSKNNFFFAAVPLSPCGPVVLWLIMFFLEWVRIRKNDLVATPPLAVASESRPWSFCRPCFHSLL